MPANTKNFRLPSDLLGVTPLTYVPDRQDGNLIAALGPACNKVNRAFDSLGIVSNFEEMHPGSQAEMEEELDEQDIVSIIESWLGQRSDHLNKQVIRFRDVDRELNLPVGSAKKHLEEAAKRWYEVSRSGKSTILFQNKTFARDDNLPF